MVDLNSTIAIVALNLNGLNTAIKNRYYHIGLGGKKTQLDDVSKKSTLNLTVEGAANWLTGQIQHMNCCREWFLQLLRVVKKMRRNRR